MQQEYRLVIKNDRYQTVDLFRVIFLSILCTGFIIIAYYNNDMMDMFWPMMLCISIAFAQNEKIVTRFAFMRFLRIHRSAFIWAIAGSFFLFPWWITLLVTTICILQLSVKEHFHVIAAGNQLTITSLPEKIIDWKSLQNVVIKDDLLTIDYRNNKIFQAPVNTTSSNIGNEAEFNEFCRLQISSHQ
ncbi:hypothetical protein I5907_19190 [Panacibacter sp. DH6]|uniref:Uncharacterized protein n=1 Tax=Panacibacter microcysteis TaxID=2793269 RepID=A0A931GZV3_9BACT|nr:hypothetical protein [Panacibacter microcysteis]MBG9378372.1 hypothetical protein [Panacibacter microcysteis]